MMLLNLIAAVAGSIVAICIFAVVSSVIKARQALATYKKRSLGLPMLDGPNPILANHGVEFQVGRNVANKITKWHQKYGDTFGFVCGTYPCASTIDLDLLKMIHIDELTAHVNRMPFNTITSEFEKDGIFLAKDDQWRRIRKAVGPALR